MKERPSGSYGLRGEEVPNPIEKIDSPDRTVKPNKASKLANLTSTDEDFAQFLREREEVVKRRRRLAALADRLEGEWEEEDEAAGLEQEEPITMVGMGPGIVEQKDEPIVLTANKEGPLVIEPVSWQAGDEDITQEWRPQPTNLDIMKMKIRNYERENGEIILNTTERKFCMDMLAIMQGADKDEQKELLSHAPSLFHDEEYMQICIIKVILEQKKIT